MITYLLKITVFIVALLHVNNELIHAPSPKQPHPANYTIAEEREIRRSERREDSRLQYLQNMWHDGYHVETDRVLHRLRKNRKKWSKNRRLLRKWQQ